MARSDRNRAHLYLGGLALVFFGPLLLAAFMYYSGSFAGGGGRSNHGALLEPIINLGRKLPGSALAAHNDGKWLLLYAHDHECGEDCRRSLYTIRQSRTMLGKDMHRVGRVFLHGDIAADTVFFAAEYPGLITLEDAGLSRLLDNQRPVDVPAGGYYLIDPLGNLVMYFRPDIDPAEMVDDIKHLLRLSQIG